MSENFGSSISFFGKVDRKGDRITSEYPSWMLDVHVDELRESVAQRERALERGDVAPSEVNYIREALKKEKARLAEIDVAKPKLTSEQTDKVAKEYDKLGKEIKDSMFSYDEMQKGLANPHEEARRMVNPCIKVDFEVARACGVTPNEKGLVSRNDAAKIFKISGKFLGENTNVEALRRGR